MFFREIILREPMIDMNLHQFMIQFTGILLSTVSYTLCSPQEFAYCYYQLLLTLFYFSESK